MWVGSNFPPTKNIAPILLHIEALVGGQVGGGQVEVWWVGREVLGKEVGWQRLQQVGGQISELVEVLVGGQVGRQVGWWVISWGGGREELALWALLTDKERIEQEQY